MMKKEIFLDITRLFQMENDLSKLLCKLLIIYIETGAYIANEKKILIFMTVVIPITNIL